MALKQSHQSKTGYKYSLDGKLKFQVVNLILETELSYVKTILLFHSSTMCCTYVLYTSVHGIWILIPIKCY